MMTDIVENYEKEAWVSLYQFALIELEEAKIAGRIDAARNAIIARLERLQTLPDPHPKERQAIEVAMRGLHFLDAGQ